MVTSNGAIKRNKTNLSVDIIDTNVHVKTKDPPRNRFQDLTPQLWKVRISERRHSLGVTVIHVCESKRYYSLKIRCIWLIDESSQLV